MTYINGEKMDDSWKDVIPTENNGEKIERITHIYASVYDSYLSLSDSLHSV